jgi:hypothetical protein
VFEVADEYKGDFARVYFYFATRYMTRISDYTSGTGNVVFTASTYLGLTNWAINQLLEWHRNDPVSTLETRRNDAVYTIQKNRNPFVDYPGLEQYIWGSYTDVAFSYDNYVQPEATGISEVHKALAPSADESVYDLRGQRHEGRLQKRGIYIRQKRKILVR